MSKVMSKASQIDREGLLPTPVVGVAVQWFPQADRGNTPCAATVTKIETVGRIQVELHESQPFSPRRLVSGVHHMSDKKHANNDANTRQSGGWDFIPDYDPYDAAIKDRDRREFAKLEQEEKMAKAREEYEKRKLVTT